MREDLPMYWIKTHKLAVVLILIILFLLLRGEFIGTNLTSLPSARFAPTKEYGLSEQSKIGFSIPVTDRGAPISDNSNRIVIKDSQLSLVVDDVRNSGDAILTYARKAGGFMVNTTYNRPNEVAFATITIRIPTNKLDEALAYFRSIARNVTSENLNGTDVTDQYVDIEKRLVTLDQTEGKFKEILAKATSVQDILTVQQQLISLQDQIDSLKGQKLSLEKQAQYTSVTFYLSTDELALPYAPDNAFRPNVIFKEAVRSLVGTIRDLTQVVIWLAVYAVIWVPVLATIIFYKKRRSKNSPPSTS